MERIFIAGFILCASALLAFWLVTRPGSAEPDILAGLRADAARGEAVFRAGGCAGCHAAKEAEAAERLKLGGGQRFASPFGTFVAPNISPDPEHGIGSWSSLDLVNAMHHGVSPTGQAHMERGGNRRVSHLGLHARFRHGGRRDGRGGGKHIATAARRPRGDCRLSQGRAAGEMRRV